MKNLTNNAFRTAALALAFAASFGLAEAQAQSATEASPSTSHPASIQSSRNFSQTANPSTGATESAPSSPCEYDLNGDGSVGFADYLQLLSVMSNQASTANSGQSKVSFSDIVGLMSAWGDC